MTPRFLNMSNGTDKGVIFKGEKRAGLEADRAKSSLLCN